MHIYMKSSGDAQTPVETFARRLHIEPARQSLDQKRAYMRALQAGQCTVVFVSTGKGRE